MKRLILLLCYLACGFGQCYNLEQFHFQPGKQFTYGVRARMYTGQATKTSLYAGPFVEYDINIAAVGPNTLHFKPQNVKAPTGHKRLSPNLIDYLESGVQVEFEHGNVKSIRVEAALPEWAHALKKSQVTQFIILHGANKMKSNPATNSVRERTTNRNMIEATEETSYGKCRVKYGLSQKIVDTRAAQLDMYMEEEDKTNLSNSNSSESTEEPVSPCQSADRYEFTKSIDLSTCDSRDDALNMTYGRKMSKLIISRLTGCGNVILQIDVEESTKRNYMERRYIEHATLHSVTPVTNVRQLTQQRTLTGLTFYPVERDLYVTATRGRESLRDDYDTLLPLTPIAFTKYRLNSPYRILLANEPECFCSAPTQEDSHPVMACSATDHQKMFESNQAGFVFQSDGTTGSTQPYHEALHIRNMNIMPYEWCLPMKNYAPVYYCKPSAPGTTGMWKLNPAGGNVKIDRFKFREINQLKDAGQHRRQVAITTNRDPILFRIDPFVSLQSNMYNFAFTQPPLEVIEAHTRNVDLVDHLVVENDSPAEVTREITATDEVTDEFAWGFSEQFKIYTKVTGKATVPFAESTVETGFEFTGTATQNWKTTTKKTISVKYAVKVPAHSHVTVHAWYGLVKGLDMKYEAESIVTGTMQRVTKYDEFVPGEAVPGQAIADHLNANGVWEVLEVMPEAVRVKVRGVLTSTAGLKQQITVNDRPVE